MDRRTFLTTPAGLASARFAPAAGDERRVPAWEQPVFQLQREFKSPVKIAGIELLRVGRNFFVRATSSDGAAGITLTKQIEEFIPGNGAVKVPTGHGMGLEIDPEYLKKAEVIKRA
jgi:hypothetical protein